MTPTNTSSNRFDCVVNHFTKDSHPEKVRASAMLAAACFRADPLVDNVILVDGSNIPDHKIQSWCENNNIQYRHAGKPLSFAEGYNEGLRLSKSTWVALSASDIYIQNGFFSEVDDFLKRNGSAAIGCLIPQLSNCDLPLQVSARRRKISKVVPLMTLNLNIVHRQTMEKIGGITTDYSGNYNDVQLILDLNKLKLSIVRLSASVLHYGKMTVAAGSNVYLEQDAAAFKIKYPNLYLEGAFWGLKLAKFIAPSMAKTLMHLEAIVPVAFRAKYQRLILSRLF